MDVLLQTRFHGEIRLRTLHAATDSEAFARHIAGDLERLSRFLPWPARTDTPEGAGQWLAPYETGDEGRVVAAGAWHGDELVGGIVLFRHDPAAASVELGCWATAVAEGTGVVRAACVEGLRAAREELRAERVSWQCDPRNERSFGLARRLGFVHEGTLRSAYVLRGERTDVAVLGLVGAEIDRAVSGS